ncbi:MAG: carboxypeptidase regulatory-like domain-containing protein [Gammaproteobacteria bacterium]|nr:carboxypeptidase regulatory-like domain-containing protein [Gammaproteobacteria bacterium]
MPITFSSSTLVRSFCLSLFAMLAGCGGGGNGGGDESTPHGTVSGTVYAPNGTDPIANALVYQPQADKALRPFSRAASNCEEPGVAYVVKTCTGPDGTFQLSGLVSGSTTLVIAKGLFKKTIVVTVATDGTVALSKEQSTLPNAETDGAQVPRIAIVTGAYDRMEDVFAKLGLGTVDANGRLMLGTERFTLYSGTGDLLPTSYRKFDVLLADIGELKKYDLIVINCGTDYEDSLASADVRARLRQYVIDGGRIYATDLSYDFIEQPFPEFVDFAGSDEVAAGAPEHLSAAELGKEGITTNASVLDVSLSGWLGLSVTCGPNASNCVNGDGTVHVEDFLGGWAVINGAHAGANVKFWTEGNVSWYSGPTLTETTSGVKPLTLNFTVGAGKVLFSSYHTSGSPHTHFLAQERILQYLIFEIVE